MMENICKEYDGSGFGVDLAASDRRDAVDMALETPVNRCCIFSFFPP